MKAPDKITSSKKYGHIVVHSAGSELLHPASTAAHKTAVPAIIAIQLFNATATALNCILQICCLSIALISSIVAYIASRKE